MPAISSPVLIGVDGSASSVEALDIAAREALTRHRALRVVHATIWPMLDVSLEPPPGMPLGGLRRSAMKILEDAVARARVAYPSLEVTGEVIAGDAAVVLLECARSAALTVLGSRGLGGFGGLLLGSVAAKLASHSACPTIVVRGSSHPDGHIVVGVDGSEQGRAALGFAFEAAALSSQHLRAVHAWTEPGPLSGRVQVVDVVFDPVEVQRDEQRLLSETLAGWRAEFPDVTVREHVVYANPRKALIDASAGSRLVVVGSRGRGGVAGLLLGSVSQALLHHSECPVAVIR